METPPASRDLLIPILLGVISILGIAVVILLGRSLNSAAPVTLTPSATPFQFLFLGTEPAAGTPLEGTSEDLPSLEETDVEPPSLFPTDSAPTESRITPTRGSVATPLILPTSNRTATPPALVLRTNTPGQAVTPGGSTPTRAATSVVGTVTPTSTLEPNTPTASNTFDDTDSRLSFSQGWTTETGVNGAYQNTLHVSDAAGNLVTFTFIGQEIQLYHQPGPGLGTVIITFDNETLGVTLDQAQSSGVWIHTLNIAGVHTVTIRHSSGGSVNIDRIVIPSPTPSPTP